MAEQLALTFPSDTFFFVGVGAQDLHSPWIHLPGIGSLNILSYMCQILIIPISLCFLLGYGVCSVPQVVAISPSSERQHGGSPWRTKDGWRSEYTPFTALFVMEARCIIYVAGQGSSRITDGVIMCNSALLHFLPIKKYIQYLKAFFLSVSLRDTVYSLRSVEVLLNRGKRERKAAAKSALTVPGCLPAPFTAPSRLMSGRAVWLLGRGWGHCPCFHVLNSCGLPAESTWYSLLSLALSYWN